MNGSISVSVATRFREQFALDCIAGILLGHARMIADNQFNTNWKENKLTAHLVAKMEETGYFNQKEIIIIPQAPLYNAEINFGDADPDKAPVIDFRFSGTWASLKYDYFAEAKNLSEANWKRPNGANVNGYHSRSYYISGGIERYLSGYYPKGCLIGYVVNGKLENIVLQLNRLINLRNSPPRVGVIQLDESASSPCCFVSQNELSNELYTLRHLLLQLA